MTDPLSSSDGPPTRVSYYDGQLLSAADFRTEQDYHRGMRYLHNRLLHGRGVVDGFDVDVDDGGGVRVGPGVAIDALGRELVLSELVCIELPPEAAVEEQTVWYLAATWDEIPSAPVAVGDGTAFSRWIERCAISMSSTAPDDEGLALLLAKLTAAAGKVVHVHSSRRRPLHTARAADSSDGAAFS